MAAARVQFGNGNNSAGGSYTFSLPAGTTNGNLLAVCIGGYDPTFANFVNLPNLNDNLGSQYRVASDVLYGNDRLTMFYIPGVASGVQTFTVAQSVPSTAVAIEYSGLTNSIDVVGAVASSPSGTSWAASSISTSGVGVILGFAVAIAISGASFAAGASYTLVVEQDDTVNASSSAVFERLNAAAGAVYSCNGTTGSSTRVDNISVAFK